MKRVKTSCTAAGTAHPLPPAVAAPSPRPSQVYTPGSAARKAQGVRSSRGKRWRNFEFATKTLGFYRPQRPSTYGSGNCYPPSAYKDLDTDQIVAAALISRSSSCCPDFATRNILIELRTLPPRLSSTSQVAQFQIISVLCGQQDLSKTEIRSRILEAYFHTCAIATRKATLYTLSRYYQYFLSRNIG